MPASRAARPIEIAIVGAGKIARDQHLPALAADPDFRLAAVADPHTRLEGAPGFESLSDLLAHGPPVDAVVICTPPQARHALARQALAAGKPVMLEKPPGASVIEAQDLVGRAESAGLALFAAWHSRHAAGVEPARAWLSGRRVSRVEIVWREDVRRWHPGQDWIFEPGGLGVFDPGINALSIAAHILPPFFVSQARLDIPQNRQAPIAARLGFALDGGGTMSADFDFRETEAETWDILVETGDGHRLRLSRGGAALSTDGATVPLDAVSEYASLYRTFSRLVAERRSEADVRPLQHVADAFMLGRRQVVAAFDF